MSETLLVSNATYRAPDGTIVKRNLADGTSITYSRSISFWPWASRGSGFGLGSVVMWNAGGEYDTLINLDMRYQQYTQYRLQTAAPVNVADMLIEFTGMVDTIDAPDINRIRIALESPLRGLDRPMLVNNFGAEADEAIEGRPQPMLIGLARNIPAVLWKHVGDSSDPTDYRYQVADVPVSAIANVRDRAFLLTPGSAPPGAGEWAFDGGNGNKGFTTGSEPVGVVTCDASTAGDAVPVGSDPPEPLEGYGDFETAFIDDLPAGFPLLTKSTEDHGGGVSRLARSSVGYSGSGHCLRLFAPARQGDWIHVQTDWAESGSLTSAIEAGNQYTWTIEILGRAGGIPSLGQSPIFTMSLQPSGQVILTGNLSPGIYSGVFTAPGTDQDLRLRVSAAGARYDVDDIVLTEITVAPTVTLSGVTLREYVETCFNRAKQPISNIDATVDEIDQTSGGIVFGAWFSDQITALAAVREPLDGFGADIYPGRDGKVKFARLRAPEDVGASDVVLTINQDNLAATPIVRTDRARGLTTKAGARRNWYVFGKSDFVDNPEQVPLSLREQYSQDFQFIVEADGGDDLPAIYAHALNAEPLATYFDHPEDAKANLQDIVDLYRRPFPRHFVDCQVWLDPAEQVNPDDIVVFRYPRYGYGDGVRMLVVSVNETITSETGRRRVAVTLWGA
jgi:hypothetical protein